MDIHGSDPLKLIGAAPSQILIIRRRSDCLRGSCQLPEYGHIQIIPYDPRRFPFPRYRLSGATAWWSQIVESHILNPNHDDSFMTLILDRCNWTISQEQVYWIRYWPQVLTDISLIHTHTFGRYGSMYEGASIVACGGLGAWGATPRENDSGWGRNSSL